MALEFRPLFAPMGDIESGVFAGDPRGELDGQGRRLQEGFQIAPGPRGVLDGPLRPASVPLRKFGLLCEVVESQAIVRTVEALQFAALFLAPLFRGDLRD